MSAHKWTLDMLRGLRRDLVGEREWSSEIGERNSARLLGRQITALERAIRVLSRLYGRGLCSGDRTAARDCDDCPLAGCGCDRETLSPRQGSISTASPDASSAAPAGSRTSPSTPAATV